MPWYYFAPSFIVKWYNVHRSRDSKHSAVPYGTISWKFFENYKSVIFQKPPCKWGWRCGWLYFIAELYKLVCGTLKQITGKSACIFAGFFHLIEIKIVKKENVSSSLLAKMYEINFHYLLLKGYVHFRFLKLVLNQNRFKKIFFRFSFFYLVIKIEKWKMFFEIRFFIWNQKAKYNIVIFILRNLF